MGTGIKSIAGAFVLSYRSRRYLSPTRGALSDICGCSAFFYAAITCLHQVPGRSWHIISL